MEKNSTGWLRMRNKDRESYPSEDHTKFEAGFYKEILDAMPEQVLKINNEFKVLWANDAVRKVKKNVHNASCYEAFHQREEVCENCPCRRCLETGVTEKSVIAVPDENGEGLQYYEVTGIPLRDGKGKVSSAVEISRNVTERIQTNYEIQHISERKDNELKVCREESAKHFEFIHKLSLDVKGDIEDMSDQLNYLHHTPEFKNSEWLESVMQLNDKTLRRIGNLNDLFTMEDTSIQLVYVPFEVTELVDEIYNRFKQRAREKNINLEVHHSKAVPKKLIGDLFRINSILMNIIENSVTHTQNGSIKVYFNAHDKTQDGLVQMQIIVSDTGLGLTDDRLEQIQALLLEKRPLKFLDQAIEMRGLGLLNAQNILKVMNGGIELDSQFGRGTQVKLNFQMGYRAEKSDTKHRDMVHEDDLPEGAKRLHSKTILIADDEVVGRVTYKIHLQENYHLLFAKNGKEAVEMYLSEKPDLVFMDIMMPIMDGFAAFDEIEKHRRKKVPIIACTAKVIDAEREYLLTYGFDDYLPKPVEASNLLRLVGKYMK